MKQDVRELVELYRNAKAGDFVPLNGVTPKEFFAELTSTPESRCAAGMSQVMFGDPRPDMVQHPPHYKRFGKEVIDIIRDTLGPEGFAAYCQGNEIKYRLRAGFKNDGSEDLAKAMKYYEFRTGCK